MQEIKNAVKNRYMLYSVCAAVVVLCVPFHTYQLWNSGLDVLELIMYPLELSGFTPFAAIFPAIPYSLRFADEYNSGYIRYILIREKKKDYIQKRICSIAISGAVMMAAAYTILFLIAWLNGAPAEFKGVEWSSYRDSIWYLLIPVWDGRLVLLLKILLASLFGAVWAMIALLCSIIFTNRYVAIAVTFLVYQLWWFADSCYNCVGLLNAGGGAYDWISANPYIMQAFTIVGLFFVIKIMMERKLKYV